MMGSWFPIAAFSVAGFLNYCLQKAISERCKDPFAKSMYRFFAIGSLVAGPLIGVLVAFKKLP
jgi:hypothetical protein